MLCTQEFIDSREEKYVLCNVLKHVSKKMEKKNEHINMFNDPYCIKESFCHFLNVPRFTKIANLVIDHESSILLDNNKLYCSIDGYIKIFDTKTFQLIKYLYPDYLKQNMSHRMGTLRHCFTLHKNKLFSTGPRHDCTIRVWDTEKYEELAIINLINCWVNSLAHDDKKLYSGTNNGLIYVWDIETYERVTILNEHNDTNNLSNIYSINSLIIHENKLFSCVSYRGVIIWDTDSYEIIGRFCFFISPNFRIDCISIYKNNLYVGSNNGHITIWKLENKHLKIKNPENYSDVEWLNLADTVIKSDKDDTYTSCRSFAFQDNKMYYGCNDGIIRIRCTETNERIFTDFCIDHRDQYIENYDHYDYIKSLIIKDNKLYSSSRRLTSVWYI